MTTRELDILYRVLWRLHRSLYAAPHLETAEALCDVMKLFGSAWNWASSPELCEAMIEDAHRIAAGMRGWAI